MEKLKAMRLLYEEKNNYWRSEIAASKGDTRRLWWTFESVLGEVPTADTDDHTADEFAAFFSDKVEAVRTSTAPLGHRCTMFRTDTRRHSLNGVQ